MNKLFVDHNKIVFSKSFRRMVHKTQVYSFNKGDHYRSRMTHTLEVAEIASDICNKLDCDVLLTNCISLAHDIGHTPYGHQGERTLDNILSGNDDLGGVLNNEIKDAKESEYGFKHSIFGAIYLQKYENDNDYSFINDYRKGIEVNIKKGLDINWKIIDGMCKHTQNLNKRYFFDNTFEEIFKDSYITKNFNKEQYISFDNALTIEGQIVAISDEIAQRQHDLDDGLKTAIDSFYLRQIKKTLMNICDIDNPKRTDKEKYLRINTIHKELDNTDIKQAQAKEERDLIKNFANEEYYINMCANNIRLYNFLLNQNKSTNNIHAFIYEIRRYLINDVVEHTKVMKKKILNSPGKFNNNEEGMIYYENVVSFSRYGKLVNIYLEKYVNNLIIRSNYVCKEDGKASYEIRQLFKAYYMNIRQLSTNTIETILKKIAKIKNINDYSLYCIKDEINIRFTNLIYYPQKKGNSIDVTDLIMFEFLQSLLITDEYSNDKKYLIHYKENKCKISDFKIIAKEIRKIFIIEITFFIASMTDNYAHSEYEKLYSCD